MEEGTFGWITANILKGRLKSDLDVVRKMNMRSIFAKFPKFQPFLGHFLEKGSIMLITFKHANDTKVIHFYMYSDAVFEIV